MRVLRDGAWDDGVLDPHRGPGDVRVAVLAWLPLAPVDGLYFRRPRSWRLVWNYAREIGLGATLNKVASRRAERLRNEVVVAAGVGRVLEAPAGSGLEPGALVELLAPRHPGCAERAVVPLELVRSAAPELVRRLAPGRLVLLAPAPAGALATEIGAIAGWSAESGVPLAPALARRGLDRGRAALLAAGWSAARALDVAAATPIAERWEGRVPSPGTASPGAASPGAEAPGGALPPTASGDTRSGGATAALFGYGNYAKTAILPSLPPGLRIGTVHEVDPLQMPRPGTVRHGLGPPHAASEVAWDTSPRLRPGERPDVVFAAGFHHTHAPLAVEALERGAVAVVEKPIATTEEDLARLVAAVRRPGRRLFACFHKRYSPLNEVALRDLGVAPGDPVSYHCIVYEVPLPERHWYRWPRSRGRIVSNGCHWLDHFLFLNGFADVREVSATEAADGTVSCAVELVSGAFFTMTLTDRGSERLGVQDHVELRASGVTVTIDNGWRYRAESGDRVLRRRRGNRLDAYRRMYREIGRAIVEGREGDSVRSIEASAGLALRLDGLLARGRAAGSARATAA